MPMPAKMRIRGARVKAYRCVVISILLMLTPSLVFAGFYSRKGEIIGAIHTYKVKNGESLVEIARKFGLGYNEITEANPRLDPFVPGKDLSIIIPTAWILPEGPEHDGIVINLSEKRLYYFFTHKGSRLVATFPVGIGSEGNDTPTGKFRVIEKIKYPTWHVPESIKKERPDLPAQIPPGRGNPLGSHALRLSSKDILIHGTNRPWGIGRSVSHGCLRLYPENILKLFRLVPVGVDVTIVRQPVKVGVKGNKVYIEVHKDDHSRADLKRMATRLLMQRHLLQSVNATRLLQALKAKDGVPVNVAN